MIRRSSLILWAALAVCPAVAALGSPGEGSALVSIDVHPKEVRLDGPFAYSQLILQGTLENGEHVDLTRDVELITPATLVRIDDRRLIRPVAEGSEILKFRKGDLQVEVPVTVSGLAEDSSVSFVRDVKPVISRLGCNAGTCHGSAQGKNGFKLSLRGYDPVHDHTALTDDLAGRRFDRVSPASSLFLKKPTAAVPHEGGQVLPPGSVAYDLLLAWVSDGARLNLEDPRVTSIQVFPAHAAISMPGMAQQFGVHATYSDGSVRDVTAESFLETSDLEVLSVDDRGLVAAKRRGEAAVLVRYEGTYSASRVVVMGDRTDWSWVETPEYNWIDKLVHVKLRQVRSRSGELCTDAEFLRRISLDLTGRIPTAKEVRIFLMDARDKRLKREELIDRLLGSTAFVEHWANRWADLLQVNSKYLGKDGARAWRSWLQGQVASNTPYDRFVSELLTAEGSSIENPASAFWRVQREPDLAMETTTQLFLGVRFSCNKCHDHPFERWTQDQHWQLAAFLGQIERKADPANGGAELISDKASGEVSNPDTGEVVAPEFPFEHAGEVPEEGPRRARLAAWMTSAENPYFARSYVNRLWAYLMGHGLIEPIDDIRAGNPPTNPELLDRLTADFIEGGFDMRSTLRRICASRTYQLSIKTNQWNVDDKLNFSHASARRLPAEILFDAVHQAAGVRPQLPGVRPGTGATELLDSSVKSPDGFLDLFGRPPRESACECERSSGMSLGQALNLVNGPTISNAIAAPGNAVADLVSFEPNDALVLDELYLRFLSRPPSEEETSQLLPALDASAWVNREALSPDDFAELEKKAVAWEGTLPHVAWAATELGSARSEGGATLTFEEDGSFRVTGDSPETDRVTLTLWVEGQGLTGLRLEVLPDPELVAEGPGRAENGNFVLGEVQVTEIPLRDPSKARPIKLQNASADFSQGNWPVAHAIDGNPATGWAILPATGKRHVAIFEAAEDFGAEGGSLLVVTLVQQFGTRHTIGHGRLSVTSSPRPVRHSGLPEETQAALLVSAGERTPVHHELLHRAYLATDKGMRDRIRLAAAQDVAWALANSPAFLFNR